MLINTEVRNTLAPREFCNAVNPASDTETPQTLAGLLTQLETQEITNLPALKSKLPLMADLLMKRADQVSIQDLGEIKPELRRLLAERRLAQNSVHTYISEIGFLLKKAKALGWKPTVNVPPAWQAVWQCCGKKNRKLITYLMKNRKSPGQVTSEDVESWIAEHVAQGGALAPARRHKSVFWKMMVSCGFTQVQLEKRYGIQPQRVDTALPCVSPWLVRCSNVDQHQLCSP